MLFEGLELLGGCPIRRIVEGESDQIQVNQTCFGNPERRGRWMLVGRLELAGDFARSRTGRTGRKAPVHQGESKWIRVNQTNFGRNRGLDGSRPVFSGDAGAGSGPDWEGAGSNR